MKIGGMKILGLNVKVATGSDGKFKVTLDVEGASSSGPPAFTGATYDAEKGQIILNVECPVPPPPLPMHLVTPMVRQTGVFRSGEGWEFNCPHCTFSTYKALKANLNRAADSHVRQVHPQHWQQSGQSKREIE